MTNIEQMLERIKALPEIELLALLEGISEILDDNKLGHLVDSAFGRNDQIYELKQEKAEIQDKLDDEIDRIHKIRDIVK